MSGHSVFFVSVLERDRAAQNSNYDAIVHACFCGTLFFVHEQSRASEGPLACFLVALLCAEAKGGPVDAWFSPVIFQSLSWIGFTRSTSTQRSRPFFGLGIHRCNWSSRLLAAWEMQLSFYSVQVFVHEDLNCKRLCRGISISEYPFHLPAETHY